MTRLPGLPPLLACLALLLAWEAGARLIAPGSVPDASSSLAALPSLLADPESLVDIARSVGRMLAGFALAVAVAVPLGLLTGRSAVAAALANPLLAAFYPVPKAALMPLLMLWVGVGDASKLLVIALGASLPVIYHARAGAGAVEEKLLWSARAMGMGPMALQRRVVLPAALPEILVGCRTGIVIALITMITSEMVVRQNGVGNILFSALDMAQYELVGATILVVSGLGIALDVLFERARLRLVGWSVNTDDLPVPPR